MDFTLTGCRRAVGFGKYALLVWGRNNPGDGFMIDFRQERWGHFFQRKLSAHFSNIPQPD